MMPLPVHAVLALIALLCAVFALVPFTYNHALLAVAVILLAVSALVP